MLLLALLPALTCAPLSFVVSRPPPSLTQFKFADDKHFTRFMKDERALALLKGYFTTHEILPPALDLRNELYELVALCFYSHITRNHKKAKHRHHPTRLFRSLSDELHPDFFGTILLTGIKFKETPARAIKLLATRHKTNSLVLRNLINFDINKLNKEDFGRIRYLYLENVGLTEFPLLDSFKDLRHLSLLANDISILDASAYYNETSFTPLSRLETIFISADRLGAVNTNLVGVLPPTAWATLTGPTTPHKMFFTIDSIAETANRFNLLFIDEPVTEEVKDVSASLEGVVSQLGVLTASLGRLAGSPLLQRMCRRALQ